MVAEPKKPDLRGPTSPFVTGPTKRVDITQPTSPLRRGVSETTRPVGRPDFLTEGMKAHRREVERRKRQASLEKLQMDEQAADTRRKIWKWTAVVVSVLVVAFGYQHLQTSYGDEWPLWYVWLLIGAALFGSIGWTLWYLNRSDL